MSDALAIPQLADHERRIANLEATTTEIRNGQRDLSDKLMMLHGENKARADAQEKAMIEEIRECRSDINRVGSIRDSAKWALAIGGTVAATVAAHLAGWVS